MIFTSSFLGRVAVGLLLLVGLSGCTTTVEVTQEAEQTFEPTSAEGSLALKIREVLLPLAQKEAKANSEEISSALARAGVDTKNLELQDSVTPTGLITDSLGLAIPTQEKCVFGYIRDNEIITHVLDQRDDGTCFVGGKNNTDAR